MSMKRYPLSVVTLTKNSADKIVDCLESVAWCDDIVIFDDYSQDNTIELAKKYTDHIYQRKWDNEGIHRNIAYSKAKNEYILSLDSDERVSPKLKDELIAIMEEGFKYVGYDIPHRNYIGDKWIRFGGWYPNAKTKIFKKCEFKYAEEECHPKAFMVGEHKILKGEIIHLVYKDINDVIKKINHLTDLEAKKWFSGNKKMSLARAIRKMIDRFLKAFIIKQGFRDGFTGFMLALMSGFYQILAYAKFVELKNKLEPIN
jgi:glycosyltransferase involved in cell wall biosynthesis